MFDNTQIRKELPGRNGERIVILKWDGMPNSFHNFMKLSKAGEVVWTVTPNDRYDAVYVNIEFQEAQLTGWTYGGFKDVIDYLTGAIIRREFVK